MPTLSLPTVKGQMLRELLTESRDFGTLLGGGGAAGSGALAAYVPSVEERKQLFEAVAYECQVSRKSGSKGVLGGVAMTRRGVARV